MRSWTFFLPLAAFAALVLLLYQGFWGKEKSDLPSALRSKPLPAFTLPSLMEGEMLTEESLAGPALITVWATWCPTCYAENGELLRLSELGVPIYGINYKDDPEAARKFLERHGNPYILNVLDQEGRLGIDLGVYGAPETFVIDGEGIILHRRVGAIDQRVWQSEIRPVLAPLLPIPNS